MLRQSVLSSRNREASVDSLDYNSGKLTKIDLDYDNGKPKKAAIVNKRIFSQIACLSLFSVVILCILYVIGPGFYTAYTRTARLSKRQILAGPHIILDSALLNPDTIKTSEEIIRYANGISCKAATGAFYGFSKLRHASNPFSTFKNLHIRNARVYAINDAEQIYSFEQGGFLGHALHGTIWHKQSPVEFHFTAELQSFVEFRVISPGINGVKVDAYDAYGTLVDSAVVFGIGLGRGETRSIRVEAKDGKRISKVDIYQPKVSTSDSLENWEIDLETYKDGFLIKDMKTAC